MIDRTGTSHWRWKATTPPPPLLAQIGVLSLSHSSTMPGQRWRYGTCFRQCLLLNRASSNWTSSNRVWPAIPTPTPFDLSGDRRLIRRDYVQGCDAIETGRNSTSSANDVVERFFSYLTAREWNELGTVLDQEVLRIGPFGDQLTGRQVYLDFLKATVPTDYGNDVLRVISTPDGRFASAKVTEHPSRYGEEELHLNEAYSFDIDEDGLICRVEIYWQTPQFDPGGFGSATSDDSYVSSSSTDPEVH